MKIELEKYNLLSIENTEEFDYKIKEVCVTHSSAVFYGLSEYVISKAFYFDQNDNKVELAIISIGYNYEIVKGIKPYEKMLDLLLNNTAPMPDFSEHEIVAVYDNLLEAYDYFKSLQCKDLVLQIKEICKEEFE